MADGKDNSNSTKRPLLPMDPQLKDIQPGGGVVIHLEQAWGRVRRWWLKRFFGEYVRRMEACRKGDVNPCPHEVLDPRDLKFHRNQGGWYWELDDDPFAWRDRIPFASAGLAELLLIGGGFGLLAILAASWAMVVSGLVQLIAAATAVAAAVLCGLTVWFFRDPKRIPPDDSSQIVSPADGKVVEIEELRHDDFLAGPAVKIGIFLSIFNVHINRAPVAARVIGLKYRPGKYLNALRPESARENEQLALLLESTDGHRRGIIVRQITGAIARRIVCWLKPGDVLAQGEQFGMIKLGSRTEIVLPHEPGLTVCVRIGQTVQAGNSVLAEFPQVRERPADRGERPAETDATTG